MNINWSLIKNGFKGFECLAVDYVNDNIDEVEWSKTPETRDGNKDAIAIYYSFGEADRKSEWWMEAKYSKKTKKLTRYRIDSTIVSAISQGNVARVVFVTNLEMDNKSMNDTKNVLLKDKCCKQVDFILKQHIEYWLINNLKKYNEYFPTLTKKKFSELQISNNGAFKTINFYAQDKFSTFSESIDKLYEQEIYKMTFSYISNKNENIEIKLIERNLMFEGNKNKIIYPIIKGINDIELNVIVIQANNNNNNNCILEIDKTKIISNRNISFIPKTNRELKIYSQINAINSIKTIIEDKSERILYIQGESGVGKSYLIEKVIKSDQCQRSLFFNEAFQGNEVYDAKTILNMILFILFPYLPFSCLDEEYLNELNSAYISKSLKDFFLSFKNYEELNKFINNISNNDFFFYHTKQLNYRIVILDNYQKLSDSLAYLFNKLIIELFEKNYPILFILSGQIFSNRKEINELKEKIGIEVFNMDITFNDLENNFSNFNNLIRSQKEQILFNNIIELTFFIQYIDDSLKDFDENNYLLAYLTFKRDNEMFNNYLRNQFNNLTNIEDLKVLCNYIYYSYQPVDENTLPEKFKPYIYKLLLFNLIKYNNNKISPIHDLYKDFYLKNYSLMDLNSYNFKLNEIDAMKNTISFSNSNSEIIKQIPTLRQYYNEQKFYTLLFILDNIFTVNENKRIFKLRLNNNIIEYFEIYYIYTMALTNASNSKSGFNEFNKLYIDTEPYIENLTILNINTLVLFEMINSEYEHMLYGNALKNIEVLYNKLVFFKSINKYLENNLFCYLSSESIKLLIKSEENKITDKEIEEYMVNLDKYNKLNEHMFPLLRLALTFISVDFEKTNILLEKCRFLAKDNSSLITKKEMYMLKFYDYYLTNISKLNINELIELNNEFKENYYNDYKRHLFIIICLYMVNSQINEGYTLFTSLFKDERELRARQKGIYHFVNALYMLLNNDVPNAKKSLLSEKQIFCKLDTYVQIIDHNLSVIEHISLSDIKYDIFHNQKYDENIFYIDGRFIY